MSAVNIRNMNDEDIWGKWTAFLTMMIDNLDDDFGEKGFPIIVFSRLPKPPSFFCLLKRPPSDVCSIECGKSWAIKKWNFL